MDFGLPKGRRERIIEVLVRFSSIKEVIVFGSRALGTSKLGSDLDFAIIGDNITYTDLLRLQRALDELPYGYSYDILDYNKIELPALKMHIDNFGVSFYKKQAPK